MIKNKTDIVELFETAIANNTYLKICAPMVRYSKLQFRTLVRKYGVDVCFTPMILADSFCKSAKARANEFATSNTDTPLIVQFAAKTAEDFVGASQLVYPYADGVDLNCGCPQRWAIKDGYGCGLLQEPEIIHKLVREFRNNLPSSFSLSVKIRLLKGLKETVTLCQQLERCGVSFLTVHGRTALQKTGEPVEVEALALLKQSIKIPLVANGDVKSLTDADELYDKVQCSGIMAARGILSNPTMFLNEVKTPLYCVQEWMSVYDEYKQRKAFPCYHHHLVFMMEKLMTRKQKQVFNVLSTYTEVDKYLEENFSLKSNKLSNNENVDIPCVYDGPILKYDTRCIKCGIKFDSCICLIKSYNPDSTRGKYFTEVAGSCDLDYMDGSLFIES